MAKKNFLGKLKETMFPANKSGNANPTYDDFKSVGTTGGSGQMSGMPTNLPKKEKYTGAKKPRNKIGSKPLAPKKSVRPKAAPRASQKLSAREAAELKQSGVKYEGIPEGSVPATAMPKGNMMLSARERAEMGMKKGGKVRGAGIARKGVRPAKMR